MFNDWFSIGPLTVHGYGVMIAVGILAASWLAAKLCKEYKLDYENIDSFIIFVIVIGYAFSKLTYCLTVFDQFLSDPLSVLGSGGWVYGGILGGLLAALIWCKWKKWKFMDYFQVLMPCVSLAQGFGRIGCFFAGCCGGAVTDAWYGIQFPATSLAWNTTQKIIPTQLLSSAGDFLIFAFLMYNLKKGKHPEDTGAWYLILYSVGRFLIEFLRGDLIRGGIGPFSTSQFISLFVVVLGAYMIWNRQRKEEKQ